jgi:hypothetical protein
MSVLNIKSLRFKRTLLLKLKLKAKIYFPKTRYILVLLFVLLFQSTLPTYKNKAYFQASLGDLIYADCQDEEHSHPPLSPSDSSHDSEKFVNLDLNNSFFIFIERPLIAYSIDGDKYFKKYIISPKLLAEQLPPARGPPLFEV